MGFLEDLIEAGRQAIEVTLKAGMIAAVIKKWTDIDDPTMLRFTIRNDLRNNNFNAASVKLLADPLAASIRQWATLGERQKYDRAVLVYETLLEEAQRLKIIG